MRYGYFDDKRREYVITRPDTPLPWINYLGSKAYFSLISNTAGGYSFYKDARLRRLTRYRYNDAPLDSNGRFIYIRDEAIQLPTGENLNWSPTWQPCRVDLDEYECRHGMGYTKIHSRKAEIEANIGFFIPIAEDLEIWELDLTNHRDNEARLSIFSAVEFCLWDALDDSTNFQRNYSIGQVEVENDIIYHKTEYRERRNHFAYFVCSEPLAGFDTQREAFLGPYRGWDSPAGVQSGILSNSIACGWQPVGVQHIRLNLKAGETKKIIFLLGYSENPEDDKFDPPGSQTINKWTIKPVISRFLHPDEVRHAFSALNAYWDELLNKLQVNTPDMDTNRMVNIWNAYQVMVTFNFSRSASYFESGIGRGMGFRDSNQDLLGFVQLIPERARERILDLAATQLADGGAYHQYQPLTKRGNNDVGSGFNDDPLWLILSTAAYLKETGDWRILEEPVSYDCTAGSEKLLYHHLNRAIQYTQDRLGPHGLPLIGRADWNDCLNLNCFSNTPGQSFQTTVNKEGHTAESVFIAGLFILAAQEMLAIANYLNQKHDEDNFVTAIDKMKQAVWNAGWDGEWFRRAYDFFGKPIGSKECEEGQIFIEPQGMCIMAGLGVKDGRAQKALDAVEKYLATPHGIVLHQPAYSRYYLHLGEISSYPPGYKENAGVFCHTNPWVMIAESRLGHGDRAFDYYLRINPSNREAISDVHKCEPYVYAQMIAGKDASAFGEAKNSWLTGTAAWNYVAITQWILGIRPSYAGLQIEPVIPSTWQGFEAVRLFRGVRYHIKVERIGVGNSVCLEVDGTEIDGTIIPFPAARRAEIEVVVKVGAV
jgi:cellobiose phosphorylase